MKCLHCGKDYPSIYYFKTENMCNSCFEKLPKEEQILQLEKFPITESSSSRYPALQTLATLFKVLAYIIGFGAAVGIITAFVMIGLRKTEPAVATLVLSLVYGIFGVITLIGYSEGIRLLLNMDMQISRQQQLLEKLSKPVPDA